MAIPEFMSQIEYAAHRGVGKSAVSNWKKRGHLVMEGRKVNVRQSDVKLAKQVDPAQGRPSAKKPAKPKAKEPSQPDRAKPSVRPDTSAAAPATPRDNEDLVDTAERAEAEGPASIPGSLANERTKEMQERRIYKALQNAQLAGELAPVAALSSKVETWISGYRERMAAALRSLDERLAQESDRRVVRAVLEQTVHDVSKDIAEQIEAGAGEDD